MACDSRPIKPQQTLQERIQEVRAALGLIDKLIIRKKVVPVVGKNGAITFTGLSAQDRNFISDACIYRRLMATGSALTKAEIARAEAIAGVKVDKKVLASGAHSHDGGRSWHDGH